MYTVNQMIEQIARINPTLVDDLPKKPKKAAIEALFEKALSEAKTHLREPNDEFPSVPPKAGTKRAIIFDLISRPEGASIDEIAEATGWSRATASSAIGTDMRGWFNAKRGMWEGCNYGVRQTAGRYYIGRESKAKKA